MIDLNFGTLNARGLRKIIHNDGSLSLDLKNVISDVNKKKVAALGKQETWLGLNEYQQKESGYICFCVKEDENPRQVLLLEKPINLSLVFRRISARVISASFKYDDKHFLFISGYAPHEALANTNNDLRNYFYNDLQKALLQKTSVSIVIIALDANAKTSYDPETHPPHVFGPFTKKGSKTNNNGKRLIQFRAENKLFLP